MSSRRLIKRIAISGLILGTTVFQAQATIESSEPNCVIRTIKSQLLPTAKNIALWIPRQQKRYWSEVLDHCLKSAHDSSSGNLVLGCTKGIVRRIVFVPRDSRSPGLRATLALNPIGWPFTLPPEILRTRYAFSLPVIGLGTWMDYMLYESYTDKRINELNDKDLTQFPGVSYVTFLNQSGLISTSTLEELQQKTDMQIGREKIVAFKTAFLNWSRDPQKNMLPRMVDFRTYGVIENDDQARALNDLAYQVAGASCSRQGSCKKLPDQYAVALEANWKAALEKDPLFSKFSAEKRYLLGQIFTPSLRFGKQSDFELMMRGLGMGKSGDPVAALQPIANALDPGSLILMAQEILLSPESLAKKREFWKVHVDSKGEPPSFTRRSDIPSLSSVEIKRFDQFGNGVNFKPLDDEISYWQLMWSDPRFSDIKQAYVSGKLSELDSLQTLLERIQSYNDFFQIERDSRGALPVSALCSLAALNPETTGNPLFAMAVEHFGQTLDKSRKLDPIRLQGCKIEVAEYLAKLYQQDAAELSGKAMPIPVAKQKEKLRELLENCPKTPRACPTWTISSSNSAQKMGD